MRSTTLLPVAILAVVLAMSPLAHAPLDPGIYFTKVTTNGDDTTEFQFDWSQVEGGHGSGLLSSGETVSLEGAVGIWTIVETVPAGWVLRSISCAAIMIGAMVGSFSVASYAPQIDGASWTVDLAHHSVTIELSEGATVICTFTNSPAGPVGGFVEPVNTFAVLSPWVAVIALAGCIATVVVVVRNRRP